MQYTPQLIRKKIVMISDYVDPTDYGENSSNWEKQFLANVKNELELLGFEFYYLETKTLNDLENQLNKFNKNEIIVFNWCEEVYGENNSGYKITTFLEENDYVFTGAHTNTLLLSYSKALMKEKLYQNNIETPAYLCIDNLLNIPNSLKFPVILKSDSEHGSFNISQNSIAENVNELFEKISKYKLPVIVEEFVQGDEYTLAMIGNKNPEPMKLQKIVYQNNKKYNLYSYDAKWNENSVDYLTTKIEECTNLDKEIYKKIIEQAKKAYIAMECKGYARMEMIKNKSKVYFLDINPNPSLEGEFLDAAKYAGYTNGQIILKICEFAEQLKNND